MAALQHLVPWDHDQRPRAQELVKQLQQEGFSLRNPCRSNCPRWRPMLTCTSARSTAMMPTRLRPSPGQLVHAALGMQLQSLSMLWAGLLCHTTIELLSGVQCLMAARTLMATSPAGQQPAALQLLPA